jgi:hypothetical protein
VQLTRVPSPALEVGHIGSQRDAEHLNDIVKSEEIGYWFPAAKEKKARSTDKHFRETEIEVSMY